MDITAFRQKHPEYNDMDDAALTKALHKKFYSDMSFGEFSQKFASGAKQQVAGSVRSDAEAEVRRLRKDHPWATAVDDTVRRLARGTPIGSWLDEANAYTASLLPESLGGTSYEKAKSLQDAKDRIADEESTVLATLPVIGDVTAGGLTKLAGAVLSAPIAPMAHAFQGASLVPRAGNAAVTGAGYGAAYGAGEGNSTDERLTNAGIGLGLGAGVGAVAVPVAQGAGNLVARLRNRSTPLPPELQQFRREAVDRVNETIGLDGTSTQQAGQNARLMGPQAMLADAGENLTTISEGLAQQPGPARTAIVESLNRRADTAGDRIRQTLDDNIGTPVNTQASLEAMRADASRRAGPLYDEFYAREIPVDQELVGILQAVPDSVWPRVRNLMQAERIDPNIPTNSGRAIDLIKRGLDDAARSAGRGTNEHRVYSNLSRALRDHVDDLISPGNPQASPWAQARTIIGEGRGAEDALDAGAGVFRGGGMAPEQVAADMQGMSQFERELYGLGARSEMRNVMGRAATNFRPNGDRNVRRALNSEFNRQNVQSVAGEGPGQRIIDTIDAENRFARTADQVMGNSATARRQASRDMIPRQYDAASMRELRGTSLSGVALEALGRIVNYLSAGALNERNSVIARDMAEMLIAQGAEREQVVRGLMMYARQIRGNNQQRTAIAGVARDIMRASAQPAIDDATTN